MVFVPVSVNELCDLFHILHALLRELADVVSFSGTSVVGNWVVPALRCLVGNIPAITATSQGIAYSALAVPTGPMMITTPDTRASGT